MADLISHFPLLILLNNIPKSPEQPIHALRLTILYRFPTDSNDFVPRLATARDL